MSFGTSHVRDLVDATMASTEAVRTAVPLAHHEPKTDAGHRQLPLTDLAVEALQRLKKRQSAERFAAGPACQEKGVANHCGLVFTRPDCPPERGNQILQRHFAPLCERLGLPRIRLHDLRHTNASLLYALGYQDADIATMLGHSSPSVTREVYVHVGAERKRVMSDHLNRVFSRQWG